MKITFTAAFLLELAAALATIPRAELQSEDLDSNYNMSVVPRGEEGWHGSGKAVCGKYANADYGKINDLVYDMDNKNYNKEWTIGGGQCNRVSCWDTSALYVCNVSFSLLLLIPISTKQGETTTNVALQDNPDPITVKGKQIGIAMKWVRLHCCFAGPRSKDSDNFVNGQQFTPWGWNVNAGYGNCRDPPEIRPHMAGGWDVNKGTCPYQEGDAPF